MNGADSRPLAAITKRAVVVGNIPYAITTPILEWLIAQRKFVAHGTVLVQREIAEYASLNQAAMQSTKVITEGLSHWERVPDAPTIDERA